MVPLPNGKNMFKGIHAVLYAMFQEDETIDAGAMGAQVDFSLARGCHGITILGLATEVLKLTQSGRFRMVEIVGRAVKGQRPFSVTISGNSVSEQVELIRVAEANGADWLILQPPLAGKFDAEVYLDFFERVASATKLPCAIQNAPQYLGRGLSQDDIARLRKRCANLLAVKSEDTALGIKTIKEAAGSLVLLGGRGGLEMTDSLRAGTCGFVLAPDIAPAAVRVFSAWEAGDIVAAEQYFSHVSPAIEFSMQSLEHLVVYGKRIFAGQAGIEVFDRAPCLVPSAKDLEWARQWAKLLLNFTEPAATRQ